MVVVWVAAGMRVTASSCVVVVVEAVGSLTTVVQDDRNMATAGSAGMRTISFFIV